MVTLFHSFAAAGARHIYGQASVLPPELDVQIILFNVLVVSYDKDFIEIVLMIGLFFELLLHFPF